VILESPIEIHEREGLNNMEHKEDLDPDQEKTNFTGRIIGVAMDHQIHLHHSDIQMTEDDGMTVEEEEVVVGVDFNRRKTKWKT